jgi:two-component system sensor histidine kinase/response regulator
MSNQTATKILIVEDDDAIRSNLSELLETQDFEVVSADNGKQGVELALETLPNLILCDVMLPKLDGYGVLAKLRENPQTATIPLIFLTALGEKADTRRGMELGADDYLTKPCTAEELLRAVSVRLNKQAIIEKQQSQKLEELRSSITLSLPHELRTPLNSILGFTELLLNQSEYLDVAETQEMLTGIQTAGNQLFRLIQNFLLYAELELQATNPNTNSLSSQQDISYPKVIITAVGIQQAKHAQRQKDLTIQLQDASVNLSTTLLKKMIEEVVSNAFKFSPQGTPVKISSYVEDDRFIVTVQDQGKGINAEQVAQIGAYMQFERKLYEQQGTGLGLTIAKRIVELHGGNLTIDSQLEKGTTVMISLPITWD